MGWLRVILGVVVLFAGRELFWLFVGVVGFVFGVDLISVLLANLPYWAVVLAGVVVGALSAALAMGLQRPIASLAGFLVGGYTVEGLIAGFSWEPHLVAWTPFIAGGVVGAIATFVLYDWALIVLSSLLGASLIIGETSLDPIVTAFLYLLIACAGIAAQSGFHRHRRSRRPIEPDG